MGITRKRCKYNKFLLVTMCQNYFRATSACGFLYFVYHTQALVILNEAKIIASTTKKKMCI